MRTPRWKTSAACCKTCSGWRKPRTTAYAAVYDAPNRPLSLTRTAAKRLDELCRIDSSLEPLREHLKAADLSLQEAAYGLRDYLSRPGGQSRRLEEVETRLAAIDRLKRKYGQSIAEMLSFLEEVRRQIAAVEHAGERMEELRRASERLAGEFEQLAGRPDSPPRRRRAQAGKESGGRTGRSSPWSAPCSAWISSARLVRSRAPTASISWSRPTRGEEPRPLEKVASGGEISRIALALKTCLAAPRNGPIRTLVFDEVDAGVGGSAAEGVGRRLKKLAATNQVLCVTHLPQIASFADHHYWWRSRNRSGRTVAAIEELDGAARTREVGRMLSGQKLTPEALKHAEQLIRLSAE